jgi:plastocyanin
MDSAPHRAFTRLRAIYHTAAPTSRVRVGGDQSVGDFSMYRTFGSIGIALAALSFLACSDSITTTSNAHVNILDECDPASFNAALGAGTCSRQGTMTLAQFNAELNATQQVAAWQFIPSNLTIRIGQRLTETNLGGEVHTFTEVAQYGGGIVPALNQASGNVTVAPECQQVTAADMIAAGATHTGDVETAAKTELYQCCIHPWMRATVTITG